MSQPKIGDVVKYRAFGREVNAIVLGSRSGETSHLGANGEPTLTLAFVDPPREQAVAPNKKPKAVGAQIGQTPQVFTEHDVVHESHSFSDEFKTKNHISSQAQIASQRGHGEWFEPIVDDGKEVIGYLKSKLAALEAEREKWLHPPVPPTTGPQN